MVSTLLSHIEKFRLAYFQISHFLFLLFQALVHLFLFFYLFPFQTESLYETQADLDLMVLLFWGLPDAGVKGLCTATPLAFFYMVCLFSFVLFLRQNLTMVELELDL